MRKLHATLALAPVALALAALVAPSTPGRAAGAVAAASPPRRLLPPAPPRAEAAPSPASVATASAAPAAPAAPAVVSPRGEGEACSAPSRAPSTPRPRPDLAEVHAGLASANVTEERAALVAARELLTPVLEPDVERLLASSEDAVVKQLGTQVLALGSASDHRETFERLLEDDDAVVQINAAYGLARTGDVARQDWLLALYDEARDSEPLLAPLLAEMLESPDLRAPTVIARYDQLAQDPTQDPETRDRAAAIARSKR